MDTETNGTVTCYELGGTSAGLYAYLAPLRMLLLCAVVGYVGWLLIADESPVARISGVCLALLFSGYAAQYFILFFRSRRHVTRRAALTDDYLEAEDRAGSRRFALRDIVFTMSYSSASTLCVIAATENDYLVLNCSCLLLLSRDGRKRLDPFYAINRAMMRLNPKHINYIRSSKNKKADHRQFLFPPFAFEADYYSARMAKCIDSLRAKHRFR